MKTPTAPKTLSAEAKRWWKRILEEYAIEDEGGLLILQTALEAFDRMRGAQKYIDDEGLMVRDRFMDLKANPMLKVEKENRAQMLQALKQLNLDLEPLNDKPGRPAGK